MLSFLIVNMFLNILKRFREKNLGAQRKILIYHRSSPKITKRKQEKGIRMEAIKKSYLGQADDVLGSSWSALKHFVKN